MTKKEIMVKIYEAQKEISEAKEAIARGNHVLDALISELNAKEAPKDPSFIVDKDGTKWFLAKRAIIALGYNITVHRALSNCYMKYMRKASYYELKLLGIKAGPSENWLISEVGLMDVIAHRRGINRGVVPAWLGGNGVIKPVEHPAESVRQIIIRVLSDGNGHRLSELVNETATAGYKRNGLAFTLDKLLKDNVIIRVNRGVYKLADKTTIVPVNPVILKEAK